MLNKYRCDVIANILQWNSSNIRTNKICRIIFILKMMKQTKTFAKLWTQFLIFNECCNKWSANNHGLSEGCCDRRCHWVGHCWPMACNVQCVCTNVEYVLTSVLEWWAHFSRTLEHAWLFRLWHQQTSVSTNLCSSIFLFLLRWFGWSTVNILNECSALQISWRHTIYWHILLCIRVHFWQLRWTLQGQKCRYG